MANRSAKRAAQTRAFYRWEDENIPTGEWLRSRDEAQRIAQKVWRWARSQPRYAKRARLWRVPTIHFGPGVLQAGRMLSYCEGHLKIVLAPTQRNMAVLLHEMVHALGPHTHGKRFQELYMSMTIQFLS